MYDLGVFPLKAFPPHDGHLRQIESASAKCERLCVVISDNQDRADRVSEELGLPLMPLSLRAQWVGEACKHLDNVSIYILDEEGLPPYPDSSEEWCQRLRELIPGKIDAVFGGDEEYRETYKANLPEAVYACLDRSLYPISSTQIRGDVDRYFQYILKPAKPFFREK